MNHEPTMVHYSSMETTSHGAVKEKAVFPVGTTKA